MHLKRLALSIALIIEGEQKLGLIYDPLRDEAFSAVRGEGATLLTPDGAPFMERYSNSTREVAQDGRRGALMLTVSIKHPDAEGFIDAKLEKHDRIKCLLVVDEQFIAYTGEAGLGPLSLDDQPDSRPVWRFASLRPVYQKEIHGSTKRRQAAQVERQAADQGALAGLGGERDIVLIAGGQGKGADFAVLRDAVSARCKTAEPGASPSPRA